MPTDTNRPDWRADMARDAERAGGPLSPEAAAEFAAALAHNYGRVALVDALALVVELADAYAARAGAAALHNLHAADKLALMIDAIFQHATGSILTPEERRRCGLRT